LGEAVLAAVEVTTVKDFDEGAAVAKIRTRLAGYKRRSVSSSLRKSRVTGWEKF
jgi:hypothetical protein